MRNVKCVKLGEVCRINMGQSPDSDNYNQNGDGLPFYQGNADFGEVNPVTRFWCSKPTKIAFEDDILFSVRAPIGAINIAKEECCIGRGLAAITAKENVCYSKYVRYVLLDKRDDVIAQGTGSTFKSINKAVLFDLQIPLPPFAEQKKIANELDKISDLIQNRKKQLEKLDMLVKSRFIEMFGDPIVNNKRWKISKWKESLVIKNGRNQQQVENINGLYPICGSGGIMGYANDYITKENSVIIGRKGNINKPILMKEKFWNVDTAFGLEPNTTILDVNYLYLFCIWYDFEKLNKAVTIPSLTRTDLLEIEIPIPTFSLQTQFANFVEQIDKSKFEIQKSLKKLEILKKALMQKYFG